jgi:hypothetical protein
VWRYSAGVADYSRGACEAGDPLGALNRVALRDDAPALPLRGIVQHGRFPERDPMSARSGLGSWHEVAALQPAAREQEPRGR